MVIFLMTIGVLSTFGCIGLILCVCKIDFSIYDIKIKNK